MGDGSHRWPAAPVRDVAQLYRLAVEKPKAGSKYHAVAEEGVPVRAIAEAIGRGLKVPAIGLPRGEGAGALLAGILRRVRYAGIERHHPPTPGMEANRTELDHRLGGQRYGQ